MAQYSFGTGVLYATPQFDASGAAIANPTPIQIGALQNISIDVSFENKTLHGQNQFALAVGRGKGKVSGSAEFAQFSSNTYNSLIFGQTLNNGMVDIYTDTTGSAIPASSPYTITPTVPGSGTWADDLGVKDATGLAMQRVASSPTTGQYSVSSGVYTFATADSGKTVFINYRYTTTASGSRNSVVQNVLMGYAPILSIDFVTSLNGKDETWRLYQVISTKLSFQTKLDDFNMKKFDFEAFADSSGRILGYATTER